MIFIRSFHIPDNLDQISNHQMQSNRNVSLYANEKSLQWMGVVQIPTYRNLGEFHSDVDFENWPTKNKI